MVCLGFEPGPLDGADESTDLSLQSVERFNIKFQ